MATLGCYIVPPGGEGSLSRRRLDEFARCVCRARPAFSPMKVFMDGTTSVAARLASSRRPKRSPLRKFVPNLIIHSPWRPNNRPRPERSLGGVSAAAETISADKNKKLACPGIALTSFTSSGCTRRARWQHIATATIILGGAVRALGFRSSGRCGANTRLMQTAPPPTSNFQLQTVRLFPHCPT